MEAAGAPAVRLLSRNIADSFIIDWSEKTGLLGEGGNGKVYR